jgi:hypothetical protein
LAHPEEWRVVRWSKEPRRTSAGEESWAASLSRLRMACFRVIDNDDTTTKGSSQYIFLKKCFGTHDAAGSFGGRGEGAFDPANSYAPGL